MITDVPLAVGTWDEKRHGMLLQVVIKNYILEFFCKKDKGWGCGSKNHQKRRAQEDKLHLFYFPLWGSKRPEQFEAQTHHIDCNDWHLAFFFFFHIALISPLNGGGNGTPLQYSCLENPMDG